eukprot:65290-Amphidinium_carterae.2
MELFVSFACYYIQAQSYIVYKHRLQPVHSLEMLSVGTSEVGWIRSPVEHSWLWEMAAAELQTQRHCPPSAFARPLEVPAARSQRVPKPSLKTSYGLIAAPRGDCQHAACVRENMPDALQRMPEDKDCVDNDEAHEDGTSTGTEKTHTSHVQRVLAESMSQVHLQQAAWTAGTCV